MGSYACTDARKRQVRNDTENERIYKDVERKKTEIKKKREAVEEKRRKGMEGRRIQ
jgi:hypothetical protein